MDDLCFDFPGLRTVEPLDDMRVAFFDVLSAGEELPGDDLVAFYLSFFSLIHTVLKRLYTFRLHIATAISVTPS